MTNECNQYPACVIPFGQASKSVDDIPFEVAADQICAPYDAQAVDGAPCAVQVFTKRMRDEECLQAAAVVDSCLNPK